MPRIALKDNQKLEIEGMARYRPWVRMVYTRGDVVRLEMHLSIDEARQIALVINQQIDLATVE